MPWYRLNHLGHEGPIEQFDDFLAPHDEAAKAYSLDRLAEHPLELWQQARMVTRFNARAALIHELHAAGGEAGR